MLFGMLKFPFPIFSPRPFQRMRDTTLCVRVYVGGCMHMCVCLFGSGAHVNVYVGACVGACPCVLIYVMAHFLAVSTPIVEAEEIRILVTANL